jgi:hypothetical protein
MTRSLDDNEDEDEEELTWDDDVNVAPVSVIEKEDISSKVETSSPLSHALPEATPLPPPMPVLLIPDQELTKVPIASPSNIHPSPPSPNQAEFIRHLQAENSSLSHRVTELESEVDQLKKELQYYQLHYPNHPHSESSVSSIEDEHPKIDSFVKVTESEGESDGTMIVLSNDLNSDSDMIFKTNEIVKKTTVRKALNSENQENMKEKTRHEGALSPEQVKKNNKNSSQRPLSSISQETKGSKLSDVKETPSTDKVVAARETDEEEEEEGWDDSGW